jgi:hypothetical protein
VAEPDAPVAIPDARPPDAAQPDARADARPPDARPPDARPPDAALPPDAGVPPCTGEIVTVDDFDDNEAIVLDTQLAIAKDGHAHVTYVAQLQGVGYQLFNADRAPGTKTWRGDSIAPTLDYLIGQTLDADGNLYTSFVGADDHHVQLARRLEWNDWAIEPAADSFSWNSSVAVETSGHVSVLMHQSGVFMHARRSPSGEWVRNPIEVGSQPGLQSSFGIDPSNVLTVAYITSLEPLLYELWLARRPTALGGWQRQPLELDGDPGHYPAMAIDEKGRLHIVHGDYEAGTLAYIRIDPDGERRDLVVSDSTSHLGRYNGIAVDHQGNVHVTSEDQNFGRLRHGLLRPDGDTFIMSSVETVGQIAGRSSIAVDPEGRVLVSFPNALTGHARVAELCAP